MLKTLINLANQLDSRGLLREADYLDRLVKRAGDFKDQCTIYNVEEDSNIEDILNIDYYDILEQIDQIFNETNIRISREDKFYEACINSDGEVLGASVISYYPNEDSPSLRFSVAISPEQQGGGIGKKLAQSIIDNHKNEWRIEAWVVNPIMAGLLSDLGFENIDGGDWSPSSPIMEYRS